MMKRPTCRLVLLLCVLAVSGADVSSVRGEQPSRFLVVVPAALINPRMRLRVLDDEDVKSMTDWRRVVVPSVGRK
jgi:hypothetical protein